MKESPMGGQSRLQDNLCAWPDLPAPVSKPTYTFPLHFLPRLLVRLWLPPAQAKGSSISAPTWAAQTTIFWGSIGNLHNSTDHPQRVHRVPQPLAFRQLISLVLPVESLLFNLKFCQAAFLPSLKNTPRLPLPLRSLLGLSLQKHPCKHPPPTTTTDKMSVL